MSDRLKKLLRLGAKCWHWVTTREIAPPMWSVDGIDEAEVL